MLRKLFSTALNSCTYIALSFLFSGINIQCTKKKSEGAYYTENYRNLFLEIGHSEEEINLKAEKAFNQLFYGDTSKSFYFKSGENKNGTLAYLSDVLHNDVRSEGMSYGMMICVQMDKKAEFDALWNWAYTYMYNKAPGHPAKGYFAWSLKTDGTPNAETPAPDGEEYFVTALYFAANRWGNGDGIYNYKAYADTILTEMRHHKITTDTLNGRVLSVGPMVNDSAKMILFVPDVGGNQFTDPSYHLPAFYELWALWGPEADREFWAAAADSSRSFFQKICNPVTGLSSDYANFDGTPHHVDWNPQSSKFSFDSWRTAVNWSVDWSWWQKDEREKELSNRIQSFFASKGMDKYGCQYTLTGEELDNRHRVGLVSANAVAGLAADHAIAKDFVEALWNAEIPEHLDPRYYDGTLYMMNLLHCSGKFRIWKPVEK